MVGEHPSDSNANNLSLYIHKKKGFETEQYITVTQLLNVYDTKNTSINDSNLPPIEDVEENYAPGTTVQEVQLETIKRLQARIKELEEENT